MKLKLLFVCFVALALRAKFLLAIPPFVPLAQNELPVRTHSVKFSQNINIEQRKVKELARRGVVEPDSIALLGNIKELRIHEKEINLTYCPGQSCPTVKIPADFPEDLAALIVGQLALDNATHCVEPSDWRPALNGFGYFSSAISTSGAPEPEGFGYLGFQLSIPGQGNEILVGSSEAKMIENPEEFMKGFLESFREVQNKGIKKTSRKNPQLMRLVNIILNSESQRVTKNLTEKSLIELANFLEYLFSGTLKIRPNQGTFLEIKNMFGTVVLPEIVEQDERAYRLQLRNILRDYLMRAGIGLSDDKSYLVVSPNK